MRQIVGACVHMYLRVYICVCVQYMHMPCVYQNQRSAYPMQIQDKGQK